MTSPSPFKCSSIDYESVVDPASCVEDLEEYDTSTELPVIRPSKLLVGTTLLSSPTGSLFNEKYSMCPLDKATGEAYQEITRTTSSTSTSTSTSTRTRTTRSRSATTSSWSSDSTELSSIAPLSETNFPSSMPRIAFADWQKFGIEFYTPKPQKINPSNMYYEYHSVSSTRVSTRPRQGRSKSHPISTTQNLQSEKSQSYSIFESKEEEEEESNSKPKLLLRRATLEGYYCPEL
ncbi:uncharacterized protein MELLADRAFT_115450 [Melampsora larici-populina 98AG31]|uniref:Uncharacterized protein n=1 Tax=Melampsora larici-populina (strain 98AG31 / pathotype 3-4-7) TaxID=747676 RepID=F4RAM6_MELLP|nr:uncharacterized protein MELLADRAFT_115450 [Melampsora larici-populina 98AG31]EGG10757.1 hypothetical protein MELLADRAFT_115450 [Melampsora larici-populina 98AG31]